MSNLNDLTQSIKKIKNLQTKLFAKYITIGKVKETIELARRNGTRNSALLIRLAKHESQLIVIQKEVKAAENDFYKRLERFIEDQKKILSNKTSNTSPAELKLLQDQIKILEDIKTNIGNSTSIESAITLVSKAIELLSKEVSDFIHNNQTSIDTNNTNTTTIDNKLNAIFNNITMLGSFIGYKFNELHTSLSNEFKFIGEQLLSLNIAVKDNSVLQRQNQNLAYNRGSSNAPNTKLEQQKAEHDERQKNNRKAWTFVFATIIASALNPVIGVLVGTSAGLRLIGKMLLDGFNFVKTKILDAIQRNKILSGIFSTVGLIFTAVGFIFSTLSMVFKFIKFAFGIVIKTLGFIFKIVKTIIDVLLWPIKLILSVVTGIFALTFGLIAKTIKGIYNKFNSGFFAFMAGPFGILLAIGLFNLVKMFHKDGMFTKIYDKILDVYDRAVLFWDNLKAQLKIWKNDPSKIMPDIKKYLKDNFNAYTAILNDFYTNQIKPILKTYIEDAIKMVPWKKIINDALHATSEVLKEKTYGFAKNTAEYMTERPKIESSDSAPVILLKGAGAALTDIQRAINLLGGTIAGSAFYGVGSLVSTFSENKENFSMLLGEEMIKSGLGIESYSKYDDSIPEAIKTMEVTPYQLSSMDINKQQNLIAQSLSKLQKDKTADELKNDEIYQSLQSIFKQIRALDKNLPKDTLSTSTYQIYTTNNQVVESPNGAPTK